jgi:hypothetical protein
MKPWIFAAVLFWSAGLSPAAPAAATAEAAPPWRDRLAGFGRDLPALAAPIGDADRRSHVGGHLEAVELLVEKLLGPKAPELDETGILVARVLEILRHLNQLQGLFADKTLPEEREVAGRIGRMFSEASEALVAVAGIELSLTAVGEPNRPGGRYFTEAAVASPGHLPLAQVSVKLPDLPEGEYSEPKKLSGGKASWRFSSATPRDRPGQRRGRFRLEVDDLPRISFTVVREITSLPSQNTPGAESR